jgi:hypothetical protein
VPWHMVRAATGKYEPTSAGKRFHLPERGVPSLRATRWRITGAPLQPLALPSTAAPRLSDVLPPSLKGPPLLSPEHADQLCPIWASLLWAVLDLAGVEGRRADVPPILVGIIFEG